jgi:predicted ATPase/Tfp pilus assembly protein PilF
LIGREAELAELIQILGNPDLPLVTIVGPGGIGKTRFALEAAATQTSHFAHGVFFVSLASLQSVDTLVPTIAETLGFSFYGSEDPQQQLFNYLRQKNLLLILDNFEHLLDGVGLVTDMLKIAPELKILITSRTRLKVQGEQNFPLEGLDFPDNESADITEKIVLKNDTYCYSAIDLFYQSARRMQPDFELTVDNSAGVIQICRLVEGNPLGLLLAAVWIQILSPTEIAAEITQSLDFLETGWSDVHKRQQSMRAVFDHSWNLLTELEQNIFRQLSVFHGGFTYNAAQRITDVSLRVLKALVNKSFLHHSATGRYEIHELLRQYAVEKLDQAPALNETVQNRHSAYYTTFLQKRETDLRGARQQTALTEIKADIENIRMAWNWAIQQGMIEDISVAANSLGYFFDWLARYQEGESSFKMAAAKLTLTASDNQAHILIKVYTWQGLFHKRLGNLEQAHQLLQKGLAFLDNSALASQDTEAERAFALLQLGDVLWNKGDHKAAQMQLEEALTRAQAAQLDQLEADTLRELGSVQMSQGYFKTAKTYFEQALQFYRKVGDQRSIGMTLRSLGITLERQGKDVEAQHNHEQSLTISRQVGYRRGEANTLNNLGFIFLDRGDYTTASPYFEQALQIRKEYGDRQGEGQCLFVLGFMCHLQGEYAEAEAVYKQCLMLAREIGSWRGESMALTYLGLLAHHRGNHQIALDYGQQALRIAQDSDDHSNQGYILTHLGHALTGLGYLERAAIAYNQALTLRCKLGQMPLSMEPLAGLARVSLAQKDLSQAQAYVDQILSHLETGTLYSTDEPLRVCLTCYRVLCANQDLRAQDILDTAYNLLQGRAAKIDDEIKRRSFLENVAAHREIVKEWKDRS